MQLNTRALAIADSSIEVCILFLQEGLMIHFWPFR